MNDVDTTANPFGEAGAIRDAGTRPAEGGNDRPQGWSGIAS
jgi:hypothetical protein